MQREFTCLTNRMKNHDSFCRKFVWSDRSQAFRCTNVLHTAIIFDQKSSYNTDWKREIFPSPLRIFSRHIFLEHNVLHTAADRTRHLQMLLLVVYSGLFTNANEWIQKQADKRYTKEHMNKCSARKSFVTYITSAVGFLEAIHARRAKLWFWFTIVRQVEWQRARNRLDCKQRRHENDGHFESYKVLPPCYPYLHATRTDKNSAGKRGNRNVLKNLQSCTLWTKEGKGQRKIEDVSMHHHRARRRSNEGKG